MDPLGTASTARKLWEFLAWLFPFLSRWPRAAADVICPLLRRTGVAAGWGAVQRSRPGRAALSVIERFYWTDYSGPRADWERLPATGLAVLWPVFVLNLALVALLPLAMRVGRGSLPLPGPNGAVAIPAWSAVLCAISFAAAWGFLLAAAAVSNRVALAAVAAVFLFSFGVMATAAPRSWWNLLAPAAALAALFFAERRAGGRGGLDTASGTAVSISVGVSAGIVVAVFTPAGPLLHGRAALLLAGAAAGVPLGIGVMAAARAGRARGMPTGAPVIAAFFVFWAANLVFLARIAWSGGLAGLSENVFMMARFWSGFLWPLWYCIGIGAVVGMFRTSDTVTEALKDTIPARLFVPAVLVLLLAGVWVTWAEGLLAGWGGALTVHAPTALLRATRALARWNWAEPVRAFTSDALRWALAGAVVRVGWLAARRRLSAGTLAPLVWGLLLVWLAVYEYFFEAVSFARSHGHTVVFLLVFALSMLWVTHTVGLKFALRSSPSWPQEGRVGLYGSALLFVFLAVHSRAAVSDTRIVDEICLSLLRGIVDVGLPYGLYVYAKRELKDLPLPAGTLMGLFCLGALGSLVLSALDKLVEAGGSLLALGARLDLTVQVLQQRGVTGGGGRLPDLPAAWWITRSALFVLALGVVGRAARRGFPEAAPARVLFSLLAFAAGIASFAKTDVDFPLLSARASALISPYVRTMEIDAHFVATYLSYLLPALTLALGVTREPRASARAWTIWAALAGALHAGAIGLWPAREPWLRATGLAATLALAGFGLLLLLSREMRERAGAPPGEPRARPVRLTTAALAGIVALALLAVALVQVSRNGMVPRAIEGLDSPVPVPERWKPLAEERPLGTLASFVVSPGTAERPRLTVRLEDAAAEGGARLAWRIAGERAAAGGGFQVLAIQSWERYYPGAVALRFSETGREAAFEWLGTAAVLPVQDGRALVLTLTGCASVDEWERLTWDLAWTAEELRHRGR